MNTTITFEIAKLLKDKGFDEKCSHYYIDNFQNFKHDGKLYKTGLPNDWDNDNILQFVKRTNQPHLCNAPTVAEVLMWLYEKHGIWICVDIDEDDGNIICAARGKKVTYVDDNFNSPTEAYLKAITYVLNNLL
jgi:hypothetical protein